MDDHTIASPSALPAFHRLRRLLRLLLAAEMLGLGAELLLMEHWQGWWQRTPLILLGVGFVALAGHVIFQNRASRRVFQLVMLLFALSGCLGIWLHYDGRAEFRREVDPSLAGWALFRAAMTGGTTPPVLAPGIMIQTGCLGLILVLRGPAATAQYDA
jgi:hypothetical protein